MASTYSTAYRFELMGTGDQTNTWGVTMNGTIGTLLEAALGGYITVNMPSDANITLTTANGAADESRNKFFRITSSGSLTATRDVIVPTVEKDYNVQNATTGSQSIRVKTSAGTGITIPTGKTMWVTCDGTNVIDTITNLPSGCTVGGVAIGTGGGSVSSVDITAPAAGITASGGPITSSGAITLALANDLAALEALSGTGIARRTGTSTWATDGAWSHMATGTQGQVPYWGGSGAPSALAVGTANFILTTQGAGANPQWKTASDVIDALIGSTQGQILYRSASAWTALAVGTSGQFLKTNGAGANPSWATSGGVVQRIRATKTSQQNSAVLIPFDDTIPQVGEGTEVSWDSGTTSITPTNASSVLEVEVVIQIGGSTSSSNSSKTVALFKDGASNAVAANWHGPGSTNQYALPLVLKYYVTAGSTSSTTFTVRYGSGTTTSMTINGESGARLLGGASISTVTITEYSA